MVNVFHLASAQTPEQYNILISGNRWTDPRSTTTDSALSMYLTDYPPCRPVDGLIVDWGLILDRHELTGIDQRTAFAGLTRSCAFVPGTGFRMFRRTFISDYHTWQGI